MMRYRPEIDGLRALAVIPVILFHAGFSAFAGGFVGVDVFFVISGFLITSIILTDLENRRFSLIHFYERRARRILPPLFLVMGVSAVFAFSWMLPDPLENFGQSLFATALFSNNILLWLTSGYWDLESEFKPLLHTWSLGVEEQYYVLFPIFMLLVFRWAKRRAEAILVCAGIASLIFAFWGANSIPKATFFSLLGRGWEIIVGSLIAFHRHSDNPTKTANWIKQSLSLLGIASIAASVFFFGGITPTPSVHTLLPTLGAALIILFADQGTAVYSVLSSRVMVGIGLISYSTYLWHQPVFALSRIYSVGEASKMAIFALMVGTVIIAVLTWRFVESPFRSKEVFSRRQIFVFSFCGSLFFIALGLLLHFSSGQPSFFLRGNFSAIAPKHSAYNEQIFHYKKDSFSNLSQLNVLIFGNSFARDFANMTIETFQMDKIEIVYRSDFFGCLSHNSMPTAIAKLIEDADVIVFSSDTVSQDQLGQWCIEFNLAFARSSKKELFFVGIKHFGNNLNWLTRINQNQRANRTNTILPEVLLNEAEMRARIPPENYISILSPIVKNGMIPITDDQGQLLSADRIHLTQFGARFLGLKSLVDSRYGSVLRSEL